MSEAPWSASGSAPTVLRMIHVGARAPFTSFRFEGPELPDIVYSETG